MAKLHTNVRSVLTALTPAIGSVIGGLANAKYIADACLPKVRISGNQNLSGALLRYRADANFGDINLNSRVAEGGDFQPFQAGNIVATTYTAERWGLTSMHDEMLLRYLPTLGEAQQVATLENLCMAAREALRIEREIKVATLYQTAGNWATTLASPLLFTDPAADIMGYIAGRCAVIRQRGLEPNTLFMDETTAAAMRVAPQLLGFLPTTIDRNYMNNDALIAMLKSHFGFENVQIGTAVTNSVNAAVGTFTPNYIWTDTMWIGYQPAANGMAGEVGSPIGVGDAMMTPSAGYCVELEPWTATYIEDPIQPRAGYRFEYVEAVGAFQNDLGTTLTNCV